MHVSLRHMNDHPLPTLSRNQAAQPAQDFDAVPSVRLMSARGTSSSRPGHFLQLLTGEQERFAWLRELSQLIVMIG